MAAKRFLDAFLRGMARLIGPVRNPEVDRILERSDADALRSNWEAVGSDMWYAFKGFEREHADEIEIRRQGR